MSGYVAIIFFILITFLNTSCSLKNEEDSQKESRSPVLDSPIVDPANLHSILIKNHGYVQFRKTYAGLQFIDNEKETAIEEQRIKKSNPETTTNRNHLRDKLEPFGFIKGRELLLHKFRYTQKEENRLLANTGKTVNIRFERFQNESAWQLTTKSGNDSATIKLTILPFELKYSFLDVIPGGNKEIVLLEEWYIANGYNFDFHVYEIITTSLHHQ